jgi:hypothetical protein
MRTLDQIATEVSKLVNDSYDTNPEYNFTRWKKSELIHYAEDALSMIASLFPKKFTTLVDIPLVAGTVQTISDDYIPMTKVIGSKDKFGTNASIVPGGDDRLGAIFADVCAEAVGSSEYTMTGYSMEESSNKVFYVRPPVLASQLPVTATVICAVAPIVMGTDYVPPSWTHNAVLEWMQYRAYSSEDESASSPAVAATHLEHFYAIIANIKQAEKELMPSNGGAPNATA